MNMHHFHYARIVNEIKIICRQYRVLNEQINKIITGDNEFSREYYYFMATEYVNRLLKTLEDLFIELGREIQRGMAEAEY